MKGGLAMRRRRKSDFWFYRIDDLELVYIDATEYGGVKGWNLVDPTILALVMSKSPIDDKVCLY
jgi:hypothetical protein